MAQIGVGKGKVVLVDDSDLSRISVRKWTLHHTGYVVGGVPQISLHRFILRAVKGQVVDHINGNKLDNRKENLRFCTTRQNQYNRAPSRKDIPKGVYWREDRRAWVVRLKVKEKRIFLGYFKSFEKAKEVSLLSQKKYHREFARYA